MRRRQYWSKCQRLSILLIDMLLHRCMFSVIHNNWSMKFTVNLNRLNMYIICKTTQKNVQIFSNFFVVMRIILMVDKSSQKLNIILITIMINSKKNRTDHFLLVNNSHWYPTLKILSVTQNYVNDYTFCYDFWQLNITWFIRQPEYDLYILNTVPQQKHIGRSEQPRALISPFPA